MHSLYAANADDSWRFLLGAPGPRPLFAIGINPHLANRERSDRTVTLVKGVASKAGYEGFVMLNLCPIRSRTVNDLPLATPGAALRQNEDAIANLLARYANPSIWAAWGNDIQLRAYLASAARSLVGRLAPLSPQWFCYGDLTKLGHPRHPSRLRHEWKFTALDVTRWAG